MADRKGATAGSKVRLARAAGIDLTTGHWEPRPLPPRPRDYRSRNIILVAIVITMALAVAFPAIIFLPTDFHCMFQIVIICIIVIVVSLMVLVVFTGPDPGELELVMRARAPIVDVDRDMISLDNLHYDIRRLDKVEVDRRANEMRMHQKDGETRTITLSRYEYPDSMVAAMRAAFTVNGILVQDSHLGFTTADEVEAISRGSRARQADEAALRHKRRIEEAAKISREETEKRKEEKEAKARVRRERSEKEARARLGREQRKAAKGRAPTPPTTASFTCPACGKEVGSELISCPRCGRDL